MAFKRENEYSIKEAIEALLKAYGMGDKLNETKIIASWERVAGPMISGHTRSLNIKNKILFVSLDSAPLRSELMMARSKLVEMLNKEAGIKIIDDIVIR